MRSCFSTFWALTFGFRRYYLRAFLALVSSALLLYLVPLVTQVVIDGVLDIEQPGQPSIFVSILLPILGGRVLVAEHLWVPALFIALITSVAGIFTWLRGRWAAMACEGIMVRLRDDLYDRLQHLPCNWFDTQDTGDIVQRCTSDVDTVRVFLANQMLELGRGALLLLLPIPIMLLISPWMTLASVVLVPAILFFSVMFFRQVRIVFRAKDEAEGRMTTSIQENLTGVRVVRAFAMQSHEISQFEVRNSAHRDLDYRLYVLMSRFWSLSDLLCMAQKAIVVGVGVIFLIHGRIEIGSFYFFLTAVAMFIWPMQQFGRILADLGRATVAFERLTEILALPVETSSDVVGDEPMLDGDIRFDGVTFSHREQSPVLRDVEFTIPVGQTLALVGPSGCGKSTIVNLLLRLYDIDSGAIRIGGHDLSTLSRKYVRSRIAVVLQEPFLFSKTLRENIALAHPSAAEHELHEATMAADIHESILQFEHGYETAVGERGVTLSGGQRQRIAIARALLQSPDVLVLDDALSAVDTETESTILEALRRRHGRHTTIIVAHRIATLMHADRILVLDEGKVVQSGSHATLLEQPGLYRRLWNIQVGVEGQLDETGGGEA
jgi:ATP-binding cassette subfamily B protein